MIGAYLVGVVSLALDWGWSSGMRVGMWSGLGLFTILMARAVRLGADQVPVEEES